MSRDVKDNKLYRRLSSTNSSQSFVEGKRNLNQRPSALLVVSVFSMYPSQYKTDRKVKESSQVLIDKTDS